MNNPGVGLDIWERLRKKWAELEASGNQVRVDFRLIANPDDENDILAIDVIQKVNDEVYTETVQQNAGEAYAALGISGLSMEQLVEAYKKMMHDLHRRSGQKDKDLVVTMSPNSASSGEIRGFWEKPGSDLRGSVLIDYHHYYMLNALREKLIELTGDTCQKIMAAYRSGALEFHFE